MTQQRNITTYVQEIVPHIWTEKHICGQESLVEDYYNFVHGCDEFKRGLTLASDWLFLCIRILLMEMCCLEILLACRAHPFKKLSLYQLMKMHLFLSFP